MSENLAAVTVNNFGTQVIYQGLLAEAQWDTLLTDSVEKVLKQLPEVEALLVTSLAYLGLYHPEGERRVEQMFKASEENGVARVVVSVKALLADELWNGVTRKKGTKFRAFVQPGTMEQYKRIVDWVVGKESQG